MAVKMVPAPVLAECREKARRRVAEGRPLNGVAAAVIAAVWVPLAALAVLLVRRLA